MANNYTIKVDDYDIAAGVRDSSAHCIVATAIGRHIPEATRISVDAQRVAFSIGAYRFTYLTPRPVGEYVIAFDAGDFKRIRPLTVDLKNPQITERQPARASRLIVKGEGQRTLNVKREPTRSRAFGQRLFRVNQPA